jgi:hypothetical protein
VQHEGARRFSCSPWARTTKFIEPAPNHKGLESAKPDLQSAFKKPGGAPAALDYGKCFATGMRKEGSRRG